MEKMIMESGRLKALLEKENAVGEVFIDTVSVVYPYSEELHAFGEDTAISEIIRLIEDMGLAVHSTGKGVNGYTNSVRLGKSGSGGFIAWGGQSQNGSIQLHLAGAGLECCGAYAMHKLRTSVNKFGAKITRVDLALDIRDKNIYSPEKAVQDWKAGNYTKTIRPQAEMAGTGWLSGEGGKTLYIGSKKHGSRLTRVYDKAAEQKTAGDWTRVETQLRNRDIVIPVEVLLEPAAYFSALSKVHASLVGCASKKMPPKKKRRVLVRSIRHLKNQYGLLIKALRTRFSPEEILGLIERSDKPSHYLDEVRVPFESDKYLLLLKAFTKDNFSGVDLSSKISYSYITETTL